MQQQLRLRPGAQPAPSTHNSRQHTRLHQRCSALRRQQQEDRVQADAGSPPQPHWVQQLAAAGLAASIAASAVLAPLAPLAHVPPASAAAAATATRAEQGEQPSAMGMGHHSMQARPGTAAAEFSCTPLTPKERASLIDLNGFSHKIFTSSPEAQALFDQGLLLTYNFNRPEAVNSFRSGLEFDPDAPMLLWGLSHAQGPYANKVWGPAPPDGSFETITPAEFEEAKADAQAALISVQSALAVSPDDPQLLHDAAYIQAEADLWGSVSRYDDPHINKALEQYAAKLESLAVSYPGDPDALGLAAEARMNISPWVHWQGPLDRRRPVKASTVVTPALADIAEALRRYPGHPMAAHLMIHLTEAGTPGVGLPAVPGNAALGEAAADSLSRVHPYPSMGHLTHMPGHTYTRLGRWGDAVDANLAALAADAAIAQRCVQPYMPEHNSQQLLYAAVNTGQLALAEQQTQVAIDFPKQYGPSVMADGRERVSRPLIQARFGHWGPVLQLTPSDIDYSSDGIMVSPAADVFGRGVFHYVRALAFASAAAHETGDARQQHEASLAAELQALSAAVDATPRDVVTRPGEGLGVPSPGFKALGRMELLAARARVDVLRGDLSSAANKLRSAIRIDQTLGYTEPPRQYQPMKECLGWVLLQQGKLKAAEQAYLEDLAELPENPWALKGLAQVYAAQGPTAAAKRADAEARFAAAWAHADPGLTLPTSCPSFSE